MQKCSRPRPRTKDTNEIVLQKRKDSKFFSGDLHKKRSKKKKFSPSTKFSPFKKLCYSRSEDREIFEDLRLCSQGQGLDLRGHGQGLQNVSSRTCSRPRTSSRTPPLLSSIKKYKKDTYVMFDIGAYSLF